MTIDRPSRTTEAVGAAAERRASNAVAAFSSWTTATATLRMTITAIASASPDSPNGPALIRAAATRSSDIGSRS